MLLYTVQLFTLSFLITSMFLMFCFNGIISLIVLVNCRLLWLCDDIEAQFPLPELTGRVNGPSWWVTRAVLTGNGTGLKYASCSVNVMWPVSCYYSSELHTWTWAVFAVDLGSVCSCRKLLDDIAASVMTQIHVDRQLKVSSVHLKMRCRMNDRFVMVTRTTLTS